MIEPWTLIKPTLGAMAPQIANRALEPKSSRSAGRERGIGTLPHLGRDQMHAPIAFAQEQRMDAQRIGPDGKECQARLFDQRPRHPCPCPGIEDGARPGAAGFDPALSDQRRRRPAQSAPTQSRTALGIAKQRTSVIASSTQSGASTLSGTRVRTGGEASL